MSEEYDVLSVGTVWIPDEAKCLVKISSVIDNLGCAYLQFDGEYELYINRDALSGLISLFNETITALDNADFSNSKSNILKFTRDKGK